MRDKRVAAEHVCAGADALRLQGSETLPAFAAHASLGASSSETYPARMAEIPSDDAGRRNGRSTR